MAVNTEQYHRLLNYLDGRLSPTDEESFVEELSADTELQKQFDFELLLRADATTQVKTVLQPEYETAEEHLQKAKAVFENKPPLLIASSEPTNVVSMKKSHRFWQVVAAALILLLGSTIFFLLRRKEAPPIAHEVPGEKSNSPMAGTDSGTHKRPLRQEKTTEQTATLKPATGPELYASAFRRYEAKGEVPGPVREFYSAYFFEKDYKKVIAATDADLMVSGTSDNLPSLHLRFYKALSWLENGQTKEATAQLNALLPQTAAVPDLQAPVRWYLAMAYLKNNDVAAAKNILQSLAAEKGASAYKAQALALQNKMK